MFNSTYQYRDKTAYVATLCLSVLSVLSALSVLSILSILSILSLLSLLPVLSVLHPKTQPIQSKTQNLGKAYANFVKRLKNSSYSIKT